ncbi:hypothetical protein CASFOL_030960 [Castilleja foliolosa]|uniref:Uncharacterized protein n=1 Tax=Castilleja foliolosa TaxID=1961234 RepID=A0ABD3C6U2_9LAMI
MGSPLISLKTPPSFSSLSSMKIKSLFQTFISSHMYPNISRAFDKAKSILHKIAKETHFMIHFVGFPILKKKNKQKKLFFGSFRLHYNWCSSSHVMPLGQESHNKYPCSHVYYDSSWNSVIKPTAFDNYYHGDQQMQECDHGDELSRYLQWLEEEKGNNNKEYYSSCNEIDKLADMFIANCHEKFRLEKQESYRRFQEMLARSA